MSMEISSNYGAYTDYSTETKKNSVADVTADKKKQKSYIVILGSIRTT